MGNGELSKKQKDQRIIYALFFLWLFIVFGLYDSPWAIVNRKTDLKVEPEYISGILSASGILFGIWALFIETKPKDRIAKWNLENLIFPIFFTSLSFLILSVLLVFLAGLNLFSPSFALGFCTLSFVLDALLLYLPLRYVKQKGTIEL